MLFVVGSLTMVDLRGRCQFTISDTQQRKAFYMNKRTMTSKEVESNLKCPTFVYFSFYQIIKSPFIKNKIKKIIKKPHE